MSAATKPAPAARRKATTPQAQRSPGRSATPAPTRPPGHVLRVVSKSGTAHEFDTEPTDESTARRRAERLARLVGRLVAPKLARGAVVVVVAVDSLAEVDRFPVKVKRRRKAEEPAAPAPASQPDAQPLLDGLNGDLDRARRYLVLQESKTNRAGHAILKAAQVLLAQLERFEQREHSGCVWKAMKDAGFTEEECLTDPSHMGLNDSYFCPLEVDVSGFMWVLSTFVSMVECGLLRPPLDDAKGGDK